MSKIGQIFLMSYKHSTMIFLKTVLVIVIIEAFTTIILSQSVCPVNYCETVTCRPVTKCGPHSGIRPVGRCGCCEGCVHLSSKYKKVIYIFNNF